jgi:hypothetical protein
VPSAPPFGRARMANDVGAVSTFSPACSDEPWGVWSFGPTDNPGTLRIAIPEGAHPTLSRGLGSNGSSAKLVARLPVRVKSGNAHNEPMTSALHPIATEQRTQFYVRSVPIGDICTAANDAYSITLSAREF